MLSIASTMFWRTTFVLMACHYVQPELVQKPKVSEAVVGGSTFFNCSTSLSSSEIHWFHYPLGETRDRSFVYGYNQFYSIYQGRFEMEKNSASGSYNLIITSVTVDDAGRYECQDDAGRGDKASAEFIVLDAQPICQSNMKPEGLVGPNTCGIEPEELRLTCAVQYHGNQAPMMEWKEVGSNDPIAAGVTRNTSSNGAIHYLTMKVDSGLDGSSFQCLTTKSTTSQYGCTSDVVIVKGSTSNEGAGVVSYVVIGLVVFVITLTAGCMAGYFLHGRRVKKTKQPELNQQRAAGNEYEEVELMTGEYLPKNVEQLQQNNEQLRKDNEQLQVNNEQLRKYNERLVARVNELKQHEYTGDNTLYGTARGPVHTIKTKASERENEKEKAPINGIAIMENNLFVINKNCRDIEVYDAKTFVFERLIQNQEFKNPRDIVASKENKSLYIFSKSGDKSSSAIVKVNFPGDGGTGWATENDYGRLSTYESNLIVCLCTKRIIIEYSPDGKTVNTIRLSPENGFNVLWHAFKISGIHFAISHRKEGDEQRVCVVHINGSILATFDELPKLRYPMSYSHLPICLAQGSEESVLVADANNERVILLNSKLSFEAVLIEIKNQTPVRLCLNETRGRVFVAVNSGDWRIPSTWNSGRILIYNIRK